MSECMTQEDAMNMSNEQAIQILKPLRDMMIDQHGCPVSNAVFALDKAIDALLQHQPERKKGKWIHDCVITEYSATGRFNLRSCECSECGTICEQESNFCPNCGADMRIKDEHN